MGALEVVRLLYSYKEREFMERLEESMRPDVVFVTDLVSCSQKRVFRLQMPLVSFRFEPAMLLGDLVHAGLEKILGENGWVTELEVVKRFEVNGKVYELRGRVDAALPGEDGFRHVVEIKTARSIEKPLEHHVLQLQIYMELLNAPRGSLVYVTPDKILEFQVERSEVDVAKLVEETVENKARPRFEWECRYCSFKRFCPYVIEKREA